MQEISFASTFRQSSAGNENWILLVFGLFFSFGPIFKFLKVCAQLCDVTKCKQIPLIKPIKVLPPPSQIECDMKINRQIGLINFESILLNHSISSVF